jgi:hypothetical protein
VRVRAEGGREDVGDTVPLEAERVRIVTCGLSGPGVIASCQAEPRARESYSSQWVSICSHRAGRCDPSRGLG